MYLYFFTDKNDEGKRRYLTVSTKTEEYRYSSFDWAKKDALHLSRCDFSLLEMKLEDSGFKEVMHFS